MPSLYTISRICEAFNITISDFFNSEIFNVHNDANQLLSSLWQQLDINEKEKVLIYIHGLLHKELKEGICKNELS